MSRNPAEDALEFLAIIPARRAATRLPDKPLLDLGGKPMVVRVAESAQASGASRVLVATDDEAIVAACRAHDVEALMTRGDHVSGTDRLAEVATLLALHDETIVVNVQGDEPLLPAPLIERCARALAEAADCAMATACHRITRFEELQNPNIVKVVLDSAQRALYFSRAPIPWPRDRIAGGALAAPVAALRHIGLYAYRARFLRAYPGLAVAPAEHTEKLEQLRALWHGYRIAVFETEYAPEAGVDTPEDLLRVRARFAADLPHLGDAGRRP
jgi:3-deoxy-manno-octulosonate cytidylyltransferase (CMP-KDO synthetase)